MRKTQLALAAVALVASTAAMAEVKISGTLEGAVANTSAPVPVSSVIRATRSADVSSDVLEILLLNTFQSDEER